MEEKINKQEFIEFQNSLIHLLIYENEYLRKKERGEELTSQDKLFDLLVPPSFIAKILYKGEYLNENKK